MKFGTKDVINLVKFVLVAGGGDVGSTKIIANNAYNIRTYIVQKKGEKLLRKKILIRIFIFFFLFGISYAPPLQTEAAKSIYYPGQYEKTIHGKTYYFSMNKYTSFETKMIGNFYIFRGQKRLDAFDYNRHGEIYRTKKNTYVYTTKKGKLTFKIKKKKMIVKQKGKILSGINLSGTYKLVQRYMHP